MRSMITCCLLLCAGMLAGQSQWSFGISLSGGVSGERSYERDNYDSQADFSSYRLSESRRQPSLGGGVWVARRWGGQWETSLGLEYRQTNRFYRSESGNFNAERTMTYFNESKNSIRLHSLEIPLEVKYFFGRNWTVRPFAGLGVAPSYVLGGHIVTSNFYDDRLSEGYQQQWVEKFEPGNSRNRENRIIFPLIASIGVEMGNMRLSLRHSWGRDYNYQPDYYYYSPYSDYYCICYPSYYPMIEAKRAYTSLSIQYQL